MKQELYSPSVDGVHQLHTLLWIPEGDVKAVLQITHGMTEHMGRYEAFAEYLVPQGIAVAGFDLRGHGRNPGDPEVASFGEGGWAASIEFTPLWSLSSSPEVVTAVESSPEGTDASVLTPESDVSSDDDSDEMSPPLAEKST